MGIFDSTDNIKPLNEYTNSNSETVSDKVYSQEGNSPDYKLRPLMFG